MFSFRTPSLILFVKTNSTSWSSFFNNHLTAFVFSTVQFIDCISCFAFICKFCECKTF